MRGRNLNFSVIIVLGVLLLYNSSCSDMIARYSGESASAVDETRGTEFYISFQENFGSGTGEIYLYVTGDDDTNGQVEISGLAFSQPFSVTARQVTRVNLPMSAMVASNDQVENLGIHITASHPLAVYGINREPATTDSFLSYPVSTCGTEYYVLSYQSAGLLGSHFTIVGTADGTAVTIIPAAASGTRPAHAAYNVSLNAGQTYRLYDAPAFGDMTGSRITADKPVAVFSGHRLTDVPSAVHYGDHLAEQLIPLSRWETCYRLMPSLNRERNTVRVLAGFDNTTVSFNGTAAAALNAGDFYDAFISAAAVISADQPILVALFAHGSGDDNRTGDPFMICLPPLRHFRQEYTFHTIHDDISSHYIEVIVPAAVVAVISLDGGLINPALFAPLDAGFSSARLAVPAGVHSVSGPVNFGLLMYGFGYNESYGNAGG